MPWGDGAGRGPSLERSDLPWLGHLLSIRNADWVPATPPLEGRAAGGPPLATRPEISVSSR